MDMFLYENVSCVCLRLSGEPMLFCIYVWTIAVLFTCLDGPRSSSLNKVFELNWNEKKTWSSRAYCYLK